MTDEGSRGCQTPLLASLCAQQQMNKKDVFASLRWGKVECWKSYWHRQMTGHSHREERKLGLGADGKFAGWKSKEKKLDNSNSNGKSKWDVMQKRYYSTPRENNTNYPCTNVKTMNKNVSCHGDSKWIEGLNNRWKNTWNLKSEVTYRDKALLTKLDCIEALFSAAIKAELQSNESRRWGLSSLCCMLCPLLMASRCGPISQVWLWKTFPHINSIMAHRLASGLVGALLSLTFIYTADLDDDISFSR